MYAGCGAGVLICSYVEGCLMIKKNANAANVDAIEQIRGRRGAREVIRNKKRESRRIIPVNVFVQLRG